MQCPNCGHELSEGHLLCEICGAEINIVPDFDIEVENSITETLSTIVDEITVDKKEDKVEEDIISLEEAISEQTKKEIAFEEEFFKDRTEILKSHNSRKALIIGVFLITVVFVVSVLLFLWLYTQNSVNYIVKKSVNLSEDGKYDSAIELIDKALDIEPERFDLYYYKADIFAKKGDYADAIELASVCIDSHKLDDETAIKLYQVLVDSYGAQGEYDTLNEELMKCTYDSVKSQFSAYMSEAPVLSSETGYYEDDLELTITSEGQGEIYYTEDGTIPSKDHGTKYVSAITLGKGEHDIRAIFVNAYGVASEISNAYYLISVKVPDPPVVVPESGSFTNKFTIRANSTNLTDRIYYTTDGSIPSEENGILYENPILPKAGKFNMSFVSISEDGIASEVVNRSYDFDITANMNAQEAINHLLVALVANGRLASIDGKAATENGYYTYTFDSVVEIKDSGYYYSLSEFYHEDGGAPSATALRYAIDPFTGQGYYLIDDGQGNMGLVPLS